MLDNEKRPIGIPTHWRVIIECDHPAEQAGIHIELPTGTAEQLDEHPELNDADTIRVIFHMALLILTENVEQVNQESDAVLTAQSVINRMQDMMDKE